MKALVLGCIDGGSKKGHIMVFQAEIYAINACIMENTEKGYNDRNIYIFLDIQAAIRALNNFRINSKLVRDCHQSLMKLGEHKRV